MQILKTIEEVRAWRRNLPKEDKLALIPTMGNLHTGHLSLVYAAQKHARYSIVSIFVNGLQFGEGEDFSSYPRTFGDDCDKLHAAGVDAVFHPDEKELYPHGFASVQIDPPPIQNELCGAFRPGHFRGVTTIVCKLFNIIQPEIACFGMKDYQQLHIIRQMITDLNFSIKVISVEIARAGDGLALSSRNGYLSESERLEAPQLVLHLQKLCDAVLSGNCDFAALSRQMADLLEARGWKVDYVEIRDADTLASVDKYTTKIVALVAARIGTTRLIDNLTINLPD